MTEMLKCLKKLQFNMFILWHLNKLFGFSQEPVAPKSIFFCLEPLYRCIQYQMNSFSQYLINI